MKATIVSCRSLKCKRPIVFLLTSTGARMPVDVDPNDESTIPEEGEVFSALRHLSHYATCCDQEKFRKGKKP